MLPVKIMEAVWIFLVMIRYSTHRSKYLRWRRGHYFGSDIINKIRIPDSVSIIIDFEIINNHDKTDDREKESDLGAELLGE